MIKLLKTDTNGNVPCPIAENITRTELRGLNIIGGTSLAGKFPELTFVLRDGDEVPTGLVDYFKSGLLHVVSNKLKSALESIKAEFEYFPVSVFYNEKPIGEYFVANPLISIKAVDVLNSDIVFDNELGDAISIKKLVLDESKFKGIKAAVIDEIGRIGLSNDAIAAIESSKCIGIDFISPSALRY